MALTTKSVVCWTLTRSGKTMWWSIRYCRSLWWRHWCQFEVHMQFSIFFISHIFFAPYLFFRHYFWQRTRRRKVCFVSSLLCLSCWAWFSQYSSDTIGEMVITAHIAVGCLLRPMGMTPSSFNIECSLASADVPRSTSQVGSPLLGWETASLESPFTRCGGGCGDWDPAQDHPRPQVPTSGHSPPRSHNVVPVCGLWFVHLCFRIHTPVSRRGLLP